jgi:hypothetical protein
MGGLGVVVAVWLLAPTMAEIPDWPARQARTSTIARGIADVLPDPPDALQAIRRLIGEDRFPRVFDALRPAPELGPPPADTGLSQEVADSVKRSTVKVEGKACGRLQDGVVAGEESTEVERYPDGERFAATVVAFDSDRDVAVLYAPGLDRPPLPIGTPTEGAVGGVFGHPGGGPLRIAPFQIGDVATATGTDIYDASRTERQVLFLAAALLPGDSGSPLVDQGGAVVGIAFAIAPDKPDVAYALDTVEVRAVLDTVIATGTRAPVSTGPCLV